MQRLLRIGRAAVLPSSSYLAPATLPVPATIVSRRLKSSSKKKGKQRAEERALEDEAQAPSTAEVEDEFGAHINRSRAHKGSITVLEGERDIREGEKFDLSTMTSSMDKLVEQLRVDLKPVVGQLDAAMPTSVVENLMVDHPENGRVPITALATVSRAQGGGLKISVFSHKDMLIIEGVLVEQSLKPSRSGSEGSAFLVKPARHDESTRAELWKRASAVISAAEAKAARARESAHKSLKLDIKNKVINDREARKESKEMDEEARARLNEMGNIRLQARKVIMDE